MLIYGDLKDQIGTKEICPFLYCPCCGVTCSGNAGDYWNTPKDKPILCGDCGSTMVLATKKTVYDIVKQ